MSRTPSAWSWLCACGVAVAGGDRRAGRGADWRSGAGRDRRRSGRRRRLPGATVTATAVAHEPVSRTTVTGRDGSYVDPRASRPASYRVRVELSGFRPLTRDGIRLATGETVRLDLQLAARRADRGGDGHRRRAAAPQRDLRARPRHRQQEGRRPAAQRPELHHAREPGARRGGAAAARGSAAAHQRRTAPHQRVPLRRHLGAAARARAGRVLSERRRDPGVQDREQQPARRVRPLQRRRRQPDDEVREQRVPRHRLRVLPPRSAERAQFLCLDQRRSSRSSAAISSAASSAGRFAAIGRSSSSTIRGSGRPSDAR